MAAGGASLPLVVLVIEPEHRERGGESGDDAGCAVAVFLPGLPVRAELVFGDAPGVLPVDQVLPVAGVAELAEDLLRGVVAVEVLSASLFGAQVAEGQLQDGGTGLGAARFRGLLPKSSASWYKPAVL